MSMSTTYRKQNLLLLFLLPTALAITDHLNQFIYHGFTGSNLHLEGLADIHSNGLLQLTNTTKLQKGHAFYNSPLRLGTNSSFSTSFVFAIYPELDIPTSGHGIAFVISSSMDFSQALPAEYLGLFNASGNGSPSNHVLSVELDTVQNAVFRDIDANHVGIDVNSLNSISSVPAMYYSDEDHTNKSLQLTSGKLMQVWIDYDAEEMLIDVKLAPIRELKPNKSLLSAHINMSDIVVDLVYIGFSSSTGISTNRHYILGWSWNQSGPALSLDPAKLPSLPPLKHLTPSRRLSSSVLVLMIVLILILMSTAGAAYVIRRKKYEELHEAWELEYAPNRFSYKDLYRSTKGFKETELLGSGGFGKVYKGALPHSNSLVAVKRISHDSKQGLREFIAEICSMRRLRHRNLVQLLGYCRRKGELLLVYEYMPNGSLDKFLFSDEKANLGWSHRIRIVKGVASALYYLHEEWEQVVLHRDVKASNVMLDANMNARLGDFGLSRLYDHGTGTQTTHVVGTIGYLAPELSITGKPTTKADVFAFGTFMLEVACGRRPIAIRSLEEEDLVEWVLECWRKGEILETTDPRLEGNYVAEEMELVLKLGLLCCHPNPQERPSMRQAVKVLDGGAILVDLPRDSDGKSSNSLIQFCGLGTPFPPYESASIRSVSSTDSILLMGR